MFYFFTNWYPFKNYEKCFLFHLKSSFHSWDIWISRLEMSISHRTMTDSNGDCNRTWTHNHLVRKQTLNYLAKLAKWLSCVVSTYVYSAFDCMFLSCHARISEWIYTLYLPECQRTSCSKQAQYRKFKWLQRLSDCKFKWLTVTV